MEYGYTGQQRLCRSCHSTFEYNRQYFEIDSLAIQFQLRSTAKYEYVKTLYDIGNLKNGLRKSYCLLKKTDSPDQVIVSVITPNINTCPWSIGSSEKLRKKFQKTLLSLKHPNIATPLDVEISVGQSDDKVFVYRAVSKMGSLRDLIYKVKAFSPFDTKYTFGNSKKSNSTGINIQKHLQRYSREILEGLGYLKSKGLAFHHLHTSNVLVVNDSCQLSDIENSFLGFKPYYSDTFGAKQENQEVLCFGHILFEMIVGIPLGNDVSNYNNYIPLYPDEIHLILSKIFSSPSTPSVEELLKLPYFSNQLPSSPNTLAIINQNNIGENGKLKKSQLSFIKEYSNKMELIKLTTTTSTSNLGGGSGLRSSNNNSFTSTSIPVMKKQTSSNSILESASYTTTSNTQTVSTPTVIHKGFKLPDIKPSTLNSLRTSTSPSSLAPPPPPPPSSSVSKPPPIVGRNALLESIRNPNNFKKLKAPLPTNNNSQHKDNKFIIPKKPIIKPSSSRR